LFRLAPRSYVTVHHADPDTGRRGTGLARTAACAGGGVTPHWHAGLGSVLALDTGGDAFDELDGASAAPRGGGALVFELFNENDAGADDFIGRGEVAVPEGGGGSAEGVRGGLAERGAVMSGGGGGGRGGHHNRDNVFALGRRLQVPLNTGGVLECTVVAAPELASRSKNASARLVVEVVRAEGLSLPKVKGMSTLGFTGQDLFVVATLVQSSGGGAAGEAGAVASARTAVVRESDEHPAWDESLNNKLAFELDRGVGEHGGGAAGGGGPGVVVRIGVWSKGVVYDSKVGDIGAALRYSPPTPPPFPLPSHAVNCRSPPIAQVGEFTVRTAAASFESGVRAWYDVDTGGRLRCCTSLLTARAMAVV
jgi:hypothetical protein